jgi:hypothetical protein
MGRPRRGQLNHYGDRGRIDVLGWHAATRALAVVEIKPSLGDAQETLGRLDVKARLGRMIGGELGWDVRVVVPVLVLSEGTTQRRHVAQHAALFRRYSPRGRDALSWLRRPIDSAPPGLLVFLDSPDSHTGSARRRSTDRAADMSGPV